MVTSGAPGEQLEASILVKNQTLVDVQVTTRVVDLDDGTGRTFEFLEPGTARRGAGDWIGLDAERLRIAAGTERPAPFTISIPQDAGAGGHYGGLVFTVRPTRPTGQFDVAYDTAIPVFVTVDGEFERDLRVQVRSRDSWRWTGGDVEWTVELHNAGDVHENVSGRLRLDTFISGSSSAPLRPGILLPGERREQALSFGVRSAPDLLRADARVERDDARSISGRSGRTVVLPWWLLLVVVLAVAVTWWRLRARRHGRRDDEWPDEELDGFPPAG